MRRQTYTNMAGYYESIFNAGMPLSNLKISLKNEATPSKHVMLLVMI